MTLKTRNNVILLGLILSFVITLSSILAVILTALNQIPVLSAVNAQYLKSSMVPIILAVLAVILGTGIQFSFRKTLSAEITLFLVFLVLSSFDALKLGMILLKILNQPTAWSVSLCRGVYFFRFAGLFCFFAAGLFSTGLPPQRLSITLGICVFISFIFALILPIDSSIREVYFLYRLGLHSEIQASLVILEVIAVLNYITAGLYKKEGAYVMAGLGAIGAVAGRELLFFQHDWLSIILGIALFTSGSILFAAKIHHIYLWK